VSLPRFDLPSRFNAHWRALAAFSRFVGQMDKFGANYARALILQGPDLITRLGTGVHSRLLFKQNVLYAVKNKTSYPNYAVLYYNWGRASYNDWTRITLRTKDYTIAKGCVNRTGATLCICRYWRTRYHCDRIGDRKAVTAVYTVHFRSIELANGLFVQAEFFYMFLFHKM
jgi:hypothetical protein